MTTSPPAELDRCPRCNGRFHCGVSDTTPCLCGSLTLSEDLQAQLRARYTGCLCLSCLKALSEGAELEAARPSAQ